MHSMLDFATLCSILFLILDSMLSLCLEFICPCCSLGINFILHLVHCPKICILFRIISIPFCLTCFPLPYTSSQISLFALGVYCLRPEANAFHPSITLRPTLHFLPLAHLVFAHWCIAILDSPASLSSFCWSRTPPYQLPLPGRFCRFQPGTCLRAWRLFGV
jgi:hypothetical protein